MKVNKVKSTVLCGVILAIFVASAVSINNVQAAQPDPFFSLVFKTNGGGVRPDYGNFLKQHVARIGITVDVIVQDWPTFVYELIQYRDFDVCYVGLVGGGADPDFTGVYDENGSLNLFGYHTSMDYDEDLGTGTNEWYMKEGNLIMPPDSEERVQHYWDWQQYMMDKINPLMPTFSPRGYLAHWATLNGYNYTDGVTQSWGKMTWTGTHTGQISADEIVIRDAAWSDLNPLFQDDSSSSLISGATMDTLIQYDADLSVWPHLADSFDMLNDTHLRIHVRDGIEWPDAGTFTNEGFDIYDVYFTFYAWKHVSNDPHLWSWIKDMKIIDDSTMDIFIDGDDSTPENEPYAPFLPSLWTNILPEHYLNVTQESDGVTPDILHENWNTFATDCFGTDLFEISAFTEGVETVLTVREDCWKLDPALWEDEDLNWEERFGFGTGWYDASDSIHNYRIRIIPDQQTALLELQAGKIDMMGVGFNPTARDALDADPDFEVQDDTLYSYGFYGYNMREVRPVVGNRDPCPLDPSLSIGLAVRKAISYAVDRHEINDVIHRGEYAITDTPLYPKMGVWNNPNIIRYNHDLDKARYYMTIAGYDLGVTKLKPGFTLLITLTSLMMMATASYIIVKKRK